MARIVVMSIRALYWNKIWSFGSTATFDGKYTLSFGQSLAEKHGIGYPFNFHFLATSLLQITAIRGRICS